MACSNNMGVGVPTLISGHRSVMLHHYIICIKNRRLFLFHLGLVYPPPLVPEPYFLMFPPANGLWEAFPSLLRHHKVKYWPRINVLGHTAAEVGNVLPNFLQSCFRQFLTNGGVLPCFVPEMRYPDINLPHHSILQATQRPQDTGCYDPRLQSE